MYSANQDQRDSDGDCIGDVCDRVVIGMRDKDGDGLPDYCDNCPHKYNPEQADSDDDGLGDDCDKCPGLYLPLQYNNLCHRVVNT